MLAFLWEYPGFCWLELSGLMDHPILEGGFWFVVFGLGWVVMRGCLGGFGVLLVGLLLVGCGGGGGSVGGVVVPAAGGGGVSGGVVVRVGGVSVRRSVFVDRMAIQLKGEPGGLVGCVLGLARRGVPVVGGVVSQSRSACAVRYMELRGHVLETLIAAEWVLGAGAEEGLGVSAREVDARLARSNRASHVSAAAFRKSLARSGENLPDVLFDLEVQMVSERIRAKVAAEVGRVTPAVAAAYYAANRREFRVAEQRDLGFLRVRRAVLAVQVKRELESGVSFAKIAGRLEGEQPVYTHEGLLSGLEPHVFREPAVDNAIFRAPKDVVGGPVRLYFTAASHLRRSSADIQNINGYYVFKVFKIRRAYYRPFGEVRASLLRSLPSVLAQRRLVSYIVAWRAKWRALTDCMPGYVVRKCRQYPVTKDTPPEDPYILY